MSQSTSERQVREPIAVVGIGCRFPGEIGSKEELWQALLQGADLVTEVPANRFNIDAFHDSDTRKFGNVRNRRGGFLDDVYSFDSEFFGIFPAEASRMDPQQRLALEAAVHTLDDAGTPLDKAAGSRTGVFLGAFMYDHLVMQSSTEQRDNIGTHLAMGVDVASIANRVSYKLDLRGPSLTLDTACSSSLVALHLACQSIWSGDSDAALAGGVNALLRPESTIVLTKAGFLSPDGACKSFDAAGNGYVRSEGVGMVYLKPLSKALLDQDRVYGVVRGSLVNSDGYTPEGFTVPSLDAQAKLLHSVYSQAGINPGEVNYVECHGPGTVVGDPKEAGALGRCLGQVSGSREDPLWISSIKGNTGHLEGASGIAGFIKAALVTFHGIVPPQANHKTPNPKIPFSALGLAVPTKAIALKSGPGGRRIVGVNSFGAGGTNAHAIIEEHPASQPSSISRHDPRVFMLSAQSLSALSKAASKLYAQIRETKPSLSDIAYTLNHRRSRLQHMVAISTNSMENLCRRLEQIGTGGISKDITSVQKLAEVRGPAFVFSGQGGQWMGMGVALAEQEPVFRDSLDAFDAIFTAVSGRSVLKEIADISETSQLNTTTVAQPAIAAIQIALANTLLSYGVKPTAIVGHSIGEVAAAHIAGALTLEQAVQIIYLRSKIQAKASGLGSMLATGLSSAEATRLIERLQLSEQVELATLNGPKMTTLAGDRAPLEQMVQELEAQGIFARFVNVEVPYHSRFMESLEDELLETLSPLQGTATSIKLYSTVTASVEPGTHLTGQYWYENIRKPVRYVEAAQNMLADGLNVFIEIGPHPVLVSGTRALAESEGKKAQIFASMVRGKDIDSFAAAMGCVSGLLEGVDLESFNGGGGQLVDLPLQTFERKHHSYEHPREKTKRLRAGAHPFWADTLRLSDKGRGLVNLRLSTGVSPFLTDHVVDGSTIFPATGHIESAYLAAKELMPNSKVWLQDVTFDHPLVLPQAEDFAPEVMLEITSDTGDYVLGYRPATSAGQDPWQACSKGRINTTDPLPSVDFEPLQSVMQRVQTGTPVDIEQFYTTLEASNFQYGTSFRGIQALWQLDKEIFASVKLPENLEREARGFRFHPALLDACLHGAFADLHSRGNPEHIYLPYKFPRIMVNDVAGTTAAFVHMQVAEHEDPILRFNLRIYNSEGEPLAVFLDAIAKRLLSGNNSKEIEYDTKYQLQSMSDMEKTPANYSTVLVLESPDSHLATIVREAFPTEHVIYQPLDVEGAFVEPEDLTISRGRRTLIVFPMQLPETGDAFQTMGVNFATLLWLSRWIHKNNSVATVAVITRGSCSTESDIDCSPFSAAIEAATRVMANELPQCRIRIIDLPLRQEELPVEALQEELLSTKLGGRETVVALRTGKRYVRRVTALDNVEEENRGKKMVLARGGRYQYESIASDDADSGVFQQQNAYKLGPEEVAIAVHAAELITKGVSTSDLGLGIAGTVLEVGSNVRAIPVGTKVVARAANKLGGCAVVHQKLVSQLPTSLAMSQGAYIPGTLTAAHCALSYFARVSSGETILIHGASRAVGIAAIRVAKLRGARVFAAVTGPERVLALENGADAIFDSHSPSLRAELLAATKNYGVDVVLNCLSEMPVVDYLTAFGRFVQLAQTNIHNHSSAIRQIGETRTFFTVDMDQLVAQQPDLYQELVSQVCGQLEKGELKAPTASELSITDLPAARNTQSVAGEQVAIVMPKDSYLEAVRPSQLSLQSDRSYLVTGGASGLGLQLARFLTARGAKNLVLVSRSGPKTPEDHAILQDFRKIGISVWLEQADVADAEAMTKIVRGTQYPAIAGVVHSAAVLRDLYSYEMTMDDFWAVFKPKAIGAWNLHKATEGLDLDFFVSISSISAVLGLLGQFNYAASNRFLDGLAHQRQCAGLPGLSLNFGVLGKYSGMTRGSTQADQVMNVLVSQGHQPLSLPTVLSAFERPLLQEVPTRMSLKLDWQSWLGAYPHLVHDGAFQDLTRSTKENAAANSSKGSLLELKGNDLVAAIAQRLQAGLARIVGLEPSRISENDGIDQFAFDSITLTQLRGIILREFRVTYAMMKLFKGPTLREIAVDVASSLGRGGDAQEQKAVARDDAPSRDLPRGLSPLSKWLVKGKPVTGTMSKVVCFHPMGTGASFFSHFLMNPPQGFEVVAVQQPGRENRSSEPVGTDLMAIADEIATELEGQLRPDDVIWGHSFGGILAFEVLRNLRRRGATLPSQCVISGTIAPQLLWVWKKRDTILELIMDLDHEYMMAISQHIENADFLRAVRPAMKRDAPLVQGYQYDATEAPLDINITAFAGRQDDLVDADEIAPWAAQANGFKLIEVDGDHWFINKNRELFAETMESIAAEKEQDLAETGSFTVIEACGTPQTEELAEELADKLDDVNVKVQAVAMDEGIAM